MDHISFQQLLDYAQNRITDRQKSQEIMQHVNKCAECKNRLIITENVSHAALHHSTTQTTEMPSPALIESVLKATKRKQQLQAGTHALSQIPATLLHDSKLAASVGVRGGGQEHELLFTFDRFDLHLSVIHAEQTESHTLIGQLLSLAMPENDLLGNQIDLLDIASNQPIRKVLTDQLGRFRISNIKSGNYGLRVTTETVVTTVDTLAFTAA